MGCSCKRNLAFQKKYGVEEEESILRKAYRLFLRVILFIIAMVVGVIVAPVMIVVASYKMFFVKDKNIMIPKLLNKYLK